MAIDNKSGRLFPGAKCVRCDRISIYLTKGYEVAFCQRLQCRVLNWITTDTCQFLLPTCTLNCQLCQVSTIVGISRDGNRLMISCDKAVCDVVWIWGPIYQHVLTLIPEWISNHMKSKLWDEIIDPFQTSTVTPLAFLPIFYNEYDYLSVLESKLIYVSRNRKCQDYGYVKWEYWSTK